MLKLLANIIIIMVLFRLLRPLASGIGRLFGGGSDRSPKPPQADADSSGYSDLTPYEIEDADFEEIKTEK